MKLAIILLWLGQQPQPTQSWSGRTYYPIPVDTTVVHGFAFVRRSLGSADIFADCIVRNDSKCLRATPQEILKSVQSRHSNIGSIDDLVRFIRALQPVECPQNQTVKLSRILIGKDERSVDTYGWSRKFNPDEVCLGDPNTGLVEFSLWCGNFVPEEVSFRKPEPPVALPVVPIQIKPDLEKPKQDTAWIERQTRDTIYVKVYGDSVLVQGQDKGQVNVLENKWVSFKNTDIYFDFQKQKKKSSVWPILTHTAAAAAGWGIGFAMGMRQETTVINKQIQALRVGLFVSW